MAKKTLASLKKCPIDFLYLWASDSFISQLGSKANIIKQKKYYQYQTLWKVMAENEKFSSTDEGQEIYNRWVKELGEAIKEVYGITPAEILRKLALGEEVAGKNFKKGVYGVGGSTNTSFVQNSNYQVNPTTGQIMAGDGGSMKDLLHQTPIYGQDGKVSGYSYSVGGTQYQSTYNNGQFVALSYSTESGVQNASGGAFDASKGSFWQNANNYMPMINSVLSGLTSIVNTYFPGNTVLTQQNTVPSQTEWVDTGSDNSGLWVVGGLAAVGVALLGFGKRGKNKKKANNK